jgi:hypothetical protein
MNVSTMLGQMTGTDYASLLKYFDELKAMYPVTPREEMLAIVNGPDFAAAYAAALDASAELWTWYGELQRQIQMGVAVIPDIERNQTFTPEPQTKMPVGLIAAVVAAYFFLK